MSQSRQQWLQSCTCIMRPQAPTLTLAKLPNTSGGSPIAVLMLPAAPLQKQRLRPELVYSMLLWAARAQQVADTNFGSKTKKLCRLAALRHAAEGLGLTGPHRAAKPWAQGRLAQSSLCSN